jgi:valyl-tRNA synthetase
MTDFIFTELYQKKSIHLQKFPKSKVIKPDMSKLTSKITEFNSLVWNKKKESNLSLKDPIKIKIPKELKQFEKDLRVMHNIQ